MSSTAYLELKRSTQSLLDRNIDPSLEAFQHFFPHIIKDQLQYASITKKVDWWKTEHRERQKMVGIDVALVPFQRTETEKTTRKCSRKRAANLNHVSLSPRNKSCITIDSKHNQELDDTNVSVERMSRGYNIAPRRTKKKTSISQQEHFDDEASPRESRRIVQDTCNNSFVVKKGQSNVSLSTSTEPNLDKTTKLRVKRSKPRMKENPPFSKSLFNMQESTSEASPSNSHANGNLPSEKSGATDDTDKRMNNYTVCNTIATVATRKIHSHDAIEKTREDLDLLDPAFRHDQNNTYSGASTNESETKSDSTNEFMAYFGFDEDDNSKTRSDRQYESATNTSPMHQEYFSPHIVQPFPHHLLSDFQCFLSHECFGYYMFLCFTLKAIRICLTTGTKPNESEMLIMLTEKQGEDDLNKFVIHLQTSLIKIPNKEFNPRVHILYKGENKLIDGLMFQAIGVLRGELSKCFDLYQKGSGNKDCLTSPPKSKRTRNVGKGGGKKKSEAIALKYSKARTDILNAWMIENKSHPFPTKTEINTLCKQTDLSHSQVVNWVTNVRKRNLKATVEKGKKPHHFLDFLFLADHRDKQHNKDVIFSVTKSKSTSRGKNKGKATQVRTEESQPPRLKNSNRSTTKSHDVPPTAKSYDSEHSAMDPTYMCTPMAPIDPMTNIFPSTVGFGHPPHIHNREYRCTILRAVSGTVAFNHPMHVHNSEYYRYTMSRACSDIANDMTNLSKIRYEGKEGQDNFPVREGNLEQNQSNLEEYPEGLQNSNEPINAKGSLHDEEGVYNSDKSLQDIDEGTIIEALRQADSYIYGEKYEVQEKQRDPEAVVADSVKCNFGQEASINDEQHCSDTIHAVTKGGGKEDRIIYDDGYEQSTFICRDHDLDKGISSKSTQDEVNTSDSMNSRTGVNSAPTEMPSEENDCEETFDDEASLQHLKVKKVKTDHTVVDERVETSIGEFSEYTMKIGEKKKVICLDDETSSNQTQNQSHQNIESFCLTSEQKTSIDRDQESSDRGQQHTSYSDDTATEREAIVLDDRPEESCDHRDEFDKLLKRKAISLAEWIFDDILGLTSNWEKCKEYAEKLVFKFGFYDKGMMKNFCTAENVDSDFASFMELTHRTALKQWLLQNGTFK